MGGWVGALLLQGSVGVVDCLPLYQSPDRLCSNTFIKGVDGWTVHAEPGHETARLLTTATKTFYWSQSPFAPV